jgi:biotin carboxyl carrier protein
MEEIKEFTDFKYEEISYRTLLTKKFANRTPYAPPDPRKVMAFIPGTILKVLVKEGQKVKKGIHSWYFRP